jgi:hypothetical protein
MKHDTAFCTQAGKTVRVIPEQGAEQSDGQPSSMESAICLDMNHRCVAANCAVTHVPTPLMALRLARSGVAGPMHHATARCPDCERETVHKVVASVQAICSECGGARRWSELKRT